MTRKTSPKGDVTQYEYANDGTLNKSTKPSGEFTTVNAGLSQATTYDAAGNPIVTGSYTDAHGVAHALVFNDAGDVDSDTYTADGVTYTKQKFHPTVLGNASAGGSAARVAEPHSAGRLYVAQRRAARRLQVLRCVGRVIRTSFSDSTPFVNRYLASYDAAGRISSYLHGPSNVSQLIDRDAQGHALRIYDAVTATNPPFPPTGRQTSFTYRSDGQPATVTQHGRDDHADL